MYVCKKSLVILMRRSPHHKTNTALSAVRRNIRQSLVQKCIMPQVRMRKVLNSRKVRYHRQPKRIAEFHSLVQRVIIQPAFRPLHPVHDAFALSLRHTCTPNGDALISRQPTHGAWRIRVILQRLRLLRVSPIFQLRFT